MASARGVENSRATPASDSKDVTMVYASQGGWQRVEVAVVAAAELQNRLNEINPKGYPKWVELSEERKAENRRWLVEIRRRRVAC